MSNVYAVDVNPIIYQGGPEGKSFFIEADKADPIPARGGGSRSPALFGVLKLPINTLRQGQKSPHFHRYFPADPCDSLAIAPLPWNCRFFTREGSTVWWASSPEMDTPPRGRRPAVYSCSHSSRAASSSTVIRAANASASASTSWIDFELEK